MPQYRAMKTTAYKQKQNTNYPNPEFRLKKHFTMKSMLSEKTNMQTAKLFSEPDK